jgi:thiol-disulfide isomerase/thioredoxin
MRRFAFVAGALALGLAMAVTAVPGAQASEPQPFERGSWAKIQAAHAGRPTIYHFWGLTCGPCLVELPHWGELMAKRRDLKLVLVAADPVPQPTDQVRATLERAGLGRAESWSFSDRFYEKLRFEIDPRWAGELPRTVMVAVDGSATVLPGVADIKKVRAWLDAQAAASH